MKGLRFIGIVFVIIVVIFGVMHIFGVGRAKPGEPQSMSRRQRGSLHRCAVVVDRGGGVAVAWNAAPHHRPGDIFPGLAQGR